jgi:hypothetical protein
MTGTRPHFSSYLVTSANSFLFFLLVLITHHCRLVYAYNLKLSVGNLAWELLTHCIGKRRYAMMPVWTSICLFLTLLFTTHTQPAISTYTIYTKVCGHNFQLVDLAISATPVADRCIKSSTPPCNLHRQTLALEWPYWRAQWLSTWHRHRMPPFQQVSSSNFCTARAAPLNCKCCYCEVETSRCNNCSAAKW